MPQNFKHKIIARTLSDLRHSLSYIDALPQLALLGSIVGLLTGAIIVCFRFSVEFVLLRFLPEHRDNFEALSFDSRMLMVAVGIALLITMLAFVAPRSRDIGVSHVLDRMHNHQAHLPFKNWCVQLCGAFICLVTGQPVGREGPAVHLGAGAASMFGRRLSLPNNSIVTLTGCGAAAAISASFDTPMAGVVFAMEVLALEYSVVGFMPVILSSVMGTMISKAAFGGSVFIVVGDTNLSSLYEIPLLVLAAAIIALCAGVYIRVNTFALRFTSKPIAIRLILAGLLTCAVTAFVPQFMGQGYDTVNAVLKNDVVLGSIALIALCKLMVTPLVIGLGVPGGLIGPTLVVGACLGGAFGIAVSLIFPSLGISPSFYVMMGMTGMIAAVLNAPLVALVTVLELTYNPNIIFPAMLVTVVACVTTRQLFNVKGIFIEQIQHSNRSLDFGAARQILRRAGVRSVMNTRFVVSPQKTSLSEAKQLLLKGPKWIILEDDNGRYAFALRAATKSAAL